MQRNYQRRRLYYARSNAIRRRINYPRSNIYRRRLNAPLYRPMRTINASTFTPLTLTQVQTFSYWQLALQNVGFTTHAAAYIRSLYWDDKYDPFPIPPATQGLVPIPDPAKNLYLKSMQHQTSLFRFQQVYLKSINFQFVPNPNAVFPIQLMRTSHIFTTYTVSANSKYITDADVSVYRQRKTDSSSFLIGPTGNSNNIVKYNVNHRYSDDLLFKQTNVGGYPDFKTRSTQWLMCKDVLYLKCRLPDGDMSIPSPHKFRDQLLKQFFSVRIKYNYMCKGQTVNVQ